MARCSPDFLVKRKKKNCKITRDSPARDCGSRVVSPRRYPTNLEKKKPKLVDLLTSVSKTSAHIRISKIPSWGKIAGWFMSLAKNSRESRACIEEKKLGYALLLFSSSTLLTHTLSHSPFEDTLLGTLNPGPKLKASTKEKKKNQN